MLKQNPEEERKKGNRTTIGYQKITINENEWKWDNNNDKLIKYR